MRVEGWSDRLRSKGLLSEVVREITTGGLVLIYAGMQTEPDESLSDCWKAASPNKHAKVAGASTKG